MTQARPGTEALEAAAEWAARLDGGDATEADRAACKAWCAEHPSHLQAWLTLQAFNDRLDGIGGVERHALHSLQAGRRARRRQLGGAGLGVLLAGLIGWGATTSPAYRAWFPDYRTAPGEQRQVALADGSQLLIDTDGAVNVEMDGADRTVDLVRGQILARVAKAEGRRFVVRTPEGSATALGTAFTVRRDPEGTLVTVLESHVRACPADAGDDPARCRDLGPGERVRLVAAKVAPLSQIDPAQAALWASGWIEADDREVAEVLAELNRYRTEPVRFDAGALKGLRVSGAYPLNDPDRALSGLAAAARLKVDRAPDGGVSVRPR